MNTSSQWSAANKFGLALIALCGVGNLVPWNLVIPGLSGSNEPGPPQGIIVADIVLGVVMIATVVVACRKSSRAAARLGCAAAIIAALTGLPAFFVAGVPAPAQVLVGVFTVLTVAAVAMTLSKPKPAL